jgi:hypothetical protein
VDDRWDYVDVQPEPMAGRARPPLQHHIRSRPRNDKKIMKTVISRKEIPRLEAIDLTSYNLSDACETGTLERPSDPVRVNREPMARAASLVCLPRQRYLRPRPRDHESIVGVKRRMEINNL